MTTPKIHKRSWHRRRDLYVRGSGAAGAVGVIGTINTIFANPPASFGLFTYIGLMCLGGVLALMVKENDRADELRVAQQAAAAGRDSVWCYPYEFEEGQK